MVKPIVAVDIDDVLAANAAGFVAYSNRKWGTNLTVADYHEHWGEIWGVDIDEVARRSLVFHREGVVRDYRHDTAAKAVLEHLAQRYKLVIVTSRRKESQQDTIEWIDRYFADIFSSIHFAGFYDNFSEQSFVGTKADLCTQLGVAYLIDDQLKHCQAAAEQGIETILFGDYPWNQTETLPAGVIRCADWQAVQELFDAA